MRLGDRVLICIIMISLLLLGADKITNGAISLWFSENLSSIASISGTGLTWIGRVLSPVLFMPVFALIWGLFFTLTDRFSAYFTKITRFIDQVSITLADTVRWTSLALVIITAVIVIQRYVFGVSSTKLQESVIYFHALLFLMSSAATLLNGGHVRVDIIYSKLSQRAKAWTDLIGTYIALIPMGVLILYTSSPYVAGAWRTLERSRESDGLPFVFLLKTAIPIFAIMMIFQGFSMAIKSVLTLTHPHKTKSDREAV